MAVFGEADPFQDWMAQLIAEKNPSEPGRSWGLARGRVPCSVGFGDMAIDGAFEYGWAFWIWLHDWDSLSPALHDRLIDVIVLQSPRICSIAWYRLQNLTTAQQRRLRAQFYAPDRTSGAVVLPTIEAQIRSRAIVPATADEDIDRSARGNRGI